MSKAKTLENMVSKSLHSNTATPPKQSPEIQEVKAKARKTTPNRENLAQISVFLEADFKSSLRLAQLRKGRGVFIDDLVAEALNDLFRKYDVPTVLHE